MSTFHYLQDKANVLDRAYFATLIRKARGLLAFIRDYDGESVCCFKMPAKIALEQLNDGKFDSLIWQMDVSDAEPSIYGEVAPEHIRLQRQAELLRRRVKEREEALANTRHPETRAYLEERLAARRAELAQVEAKLQARRAQPVAA